MKKIREKKLKKKSILKNNKSENKNINLSNQKIKINDDAKISVIIPVYNVADYLRECLDSVLAQTLEDIEIICIDDGSTDHSLTILKEYAKKSTKIKVFSRENKGVGYTRNEGINIAKGEFLAFMDPDDFYPENDILEVLYVTAKKQNVNIVGGEFARYVKGELFKKFKGESQNYLFPQEGLVQYKDFQWDYGWIRFIYNTNFLRKNQLYMPNYKRFQDPPFFAKVMSVAKNFYAIPKTCYAYRVSHKKVNWDYAKVNGLLKGLGDNLKLAREHGYQKLLVTSSQRLLVEYSDIIKAHLNLENRILYCRNILLADKSLVLNKFFLRRYSTEGHNILDIFGIKIKWRK